jgi:threonine dehydrogenase-like Zn-dependent dehydrogenase
MKGAVLYGAHDVRYVDREDPKIVEPTDAIIRMSATCVCGSDLWPYRGIDAPRWARRLRRRLPRRRDSRPRTVLR